MLFWQLQIVPLLALLLSPHTDLIPKHQHLLPVDDWKWLCVSWSVWINFSMLRHCLFKQSWQVWYAYWCVAWMQTAFLFGIIDERLTVPFQNTWHYQAAQLIILALSFMASKLFPLVNDTPSTNTKKGSTDNPVTFVRDLWVDTRIGSRRFTVPVELYYPVRPMATSAYEKENSKSSSTNSMPSSLLSNGNLAEWKSFYSQLTGISRHLLNHLSFIRTQSLPSTASTAADKLLPVAEIPASLPILIIPQDYNGYQVNPMRYLCEQMASDGWLVVSLQHHQMPGDSFLGELPLSPIPPYHKSNVSNTRRCPVSNDSANDGHSLFPNTATTLNVHAQTISNNNNNTNDDDGGDNNVSSEDELLQQQWDTWHRRLERRTAEISFVLDRLMAAQYGQPLSNGCSSNGSASIINSHNQPDGGANDDEEEDICIRLFKSRLDLERIAILGHSFGGTIAVQAAAQDRRLKAVIGLDCWTFPLSSSLLDRGLCSPTLFIQSGPAFIAADQPYGTDNDQDVRRLVVNTRAACLLRLKNTRHYDYLDIHGISSGLCRWMGVQSGTLFKRLLQNYVKCNTGPRLLDTRLLSVIAARTYLMKHVRNNRHLLAGHKKFGFTDSGPILKRKSLGLFSNTSGLFSSDTVNTAVENDLRMESNDVIGLLKSDLYYDGMVIERVGYQS